MSFTIAITGKGGVGKTTISALMVQWLVAHQQTPVLAVDADSNANLNEALGIDYAQSVGGIREDARNKVSDLSGIAKQEFLDLRVQSALVEQSGYDLDRHGPSRRTRLLLLCKQRPARCDCSSVMQL